MTSSPLSFLEKICKAFKMVDSLIVAFIKHSKLRSCLAIPLPKVMSQDSVYFYILFRTKCTFCRQ